MDITSTPLKTFLVTEKKQLTCFAGRGSTLIHVSKGLQKAIFCAIALLIVNYIVPRSSLAQSQNFTANGTFTAPAGVTAVQVECWGGGGGGGSISSYSTASRGGGGGGAYASSVVTVNPGSNYAITRGSGGSAGGNGGLSSFASTTVLAAGGSGTTGGTGGSGGAVANSTGTIRYAGGNGANGISGTSGGGGGGAGSTGAGGNGTGATGGTGTPENGGNGGAGRTSSGNGSGGNTYGGGGGGALRTSNGTATGGTGANGMVRVSWTSVTSTGNISAVTYSSTTQTTTLAYTAAGGNPVSYSIEWNGMGNQGSTAFAFASGGGTINNISIPAGTPAGTYTGTMTVTNAAGCTFTVGVSVTVNKKALTVTGAEADDKEYDGTNIAAISGANLVGVESGDDVELDELTGTFNDKNVGENKPVNVALTLKGAKAVNYTLSQPVGLTASITPANLTAEGLTAEDKVYDANITAVLTGTPSVTPFPGDVVTAEGTPTGEFADKNVGTGKAVSVTGVTISGADAGNYNLIQPAGLTANITQANLTAVGLTAEDKIYDTDITATLTGTPSVVPLASDVVVAEGTPAGDFADKNVGTGKPVSVTGVTISGADAGNYNLVQPTGLTASITPANLTVSGLTAQNKVYDATITAALTGTPTVTPLASDVVIAEGTPAGEFADKNVGTGKTVSVTGVNISGADAGNYNLIQQAGLTANITKADLTTTGLSAQNKVYDATIVAILTGTPTVTPLSTDVVIAEGTPAGEFVDKNTGTSKAVSVTGVTISGADAGNYNLIQQAGLTANITQADLTAGGLTAEDKVYDAGITAILTGTPTVTPFLSDVVIAGGTPAGTFADKNVGNNKLVTVAGVNISGADAGNYNLIQQTGLTANITSASLSVTGLSAQNKEYDGNVTANLTGTINVMPLSGDVVSVEGTPVGLFDDKHVGTNKPVSITGITLSGTDAGNYNLDAPEGLTANITSKPLTVTGATALSKVYDGNAVAVISNALLEGIVTDDDIALDALTGTFASLNVGNGISVTANLTLAGTDVPNYSFTQPTGLTANITPKALTVINAVASEKVYDGNTDATISGAALSGVIGSEDVNLGNHTTGTFAQANAGEGISVFTAMSVSGAGIGNYTLTQPTGLTANITRKALTVSGATADNKVYDGNTSATISGATLVGIVTGDVVTLGSLAGNFAGKDVANGILVTPGLTITGSDIVNYTLTQPTGLNANITPKELTVTGASASNKVYDGNADASITGATLTGVVTGDDVALSALTAAFTTRNVGNNIPVLPALAISGGDMNNYSLTQPAGLTADITPKELTVTGTVASNKVYNGNTDASVTGATLNGIVAGDNVALDALTAAFTSRNVGNNIPVLPAFTISGGDMNNYSLTQPAGLAANITPKQLTVTGATANNKVYDGNTSATISGAVLVGTITEDDIQPGALLGSFANKNTGINIPVTAAITLSGVDAGNYSLSQPTGLFANITTKELTVTGADAYDKVYDKNANAVIHGASLTGVVGGEDVALNNFSGTFADINAGNDIPVTTALVLTGADISNYTLAQPAGITANITPRVLTIAGVTANNKIYNGTTNAVLSAAYAVLAGALAGDNVGLDMSNLTGNFDTPDAGYNKPVSSSLTLTGTDAGNYSLSQPAYLTANITPKNLTITGVTAMDKVYDGTLNAVISIVNAILSGIVGDDDVAMDPAGLAGTFFNPNVANDKTVLAELSLTGADAGNYTLTQPTGLTADITRKGLTVKAKDVDRLYGQPNPAFELEYTGFVAAENENNLTTKPVATTSATEASLPGSYDIIVSGGVSNNYSFTYVKGILTVSYGTGIQPQGTEAEIKIYPNPVATELYINRGALPEHTKAQLFDINGKQIMTISLNGDPVNMSDMKPGVYFLTIEGKSYRVVKE